MTPLRLALGWTALVFALCTLPPTSLPSAAAPVFGLDKAVHAALFLGVGWLWLRAAPGRAAAVLVGGVAFGVGIELWQGALPFGRLPEAADAVADAVGLVVGMALARVRERAG